MKTATIHLAVFLLLAIGGGLGSAEEAPREAEPRFKGVELYSWTSDEGYWRFALLSGTNRLKSEDEVKAPEQALELPKLLEEVGRLSDGEQLSWSHRVDGMAYPPARVRNRILAAADQAGVELYSPFHVSRGGYVFVPREGKPPIIRKDGKEIGELDAVIPDSFSPVDDVLLVFEEGEDDDLRQYLLNVGEGELRKSGSRLDYVFGGRYVTSASWSDDGKTITLHYHADLAGIAEESFSVEELLAR